MKLKHTLLTVCLSMLCALHLAAQQQIQFQAVDPAHNPDMPAEAAQLLTQKVSQILNRTSAGAGGDLGLFVVQPALTLTGESSTSGLVNNIGVISGELTLTAKNAYDNAEFYSVTVKLKATAKNRATNPYVALAKAIKITEPIYVRFVRIARQNIRKALDEGRVNFPPEEPANPTPADSVPANAAPTNSVSQ